MRVCSGVIDGIAPANIDPDTWNPSGFDPDEWVAAAVSIGAKYAMVQCKHHDGFAMWPSTVNIGETPYSIAQTTWYTTNSNLDVVGTLIAKVRAAGLNVCLYFSTWDLTWEARTGTDETTDAVGYIAMIEAQLTELLTNYGDIFSIWFDGWKWHQGYTAIPFATIEDFVHTLQPNCVVIDNNQEHPLINGTIEVYEYPEVGSIPSGNVRPSEEVNGIRNDGRWVWVSTDDQSAAALRTAADINASIASANANEGTYLLAVTPDDTGHLPAAQATLLESVHV